VGKIYAQSAVDCSCSVALVHENMVPFYDGLSIPLSAILTDGGREYCGRQDQHFYEPYLGSQNIKHRVTRPASPYTNRFVERFHRTLKDEFFAKAFREKIYSTLEELQKDLDGFLAFYNEGRIHSGYRCQGRTPMQTLKSLLESPTSEATEDQAA